MQQSEPIKTTLSGMSDVPDLLAYPRVLNFADIPEIKGQFVYVIKAYKEEGLTIVIHRDLKEGNLFLKIGDFDGEDIDLNDLKNPLREAAWEFAQQESPKFAAMMKYAKIQKMIVYISVNGDSWELVDLRTSLNKFYGPGMIRDLFGQMFPTQDVVKTIALDEPTLEAILKGKGSYSGDLILKCSKFKTVARGKELLPMYAKIVR